MRSGPRSIFGRGRNYFSLCRTKTRTIWDTPCSSDGELHSAQNNPIVSLRVPKQCEGLQQPPRHYHDVQYIDFYAQYDGDQCPLTTITDQRPS